MKVTTISYTRILSDHQYGNHQATVNAVVEEDEDPATALAEARRLATAAVEEELALAARRASDEYEYEDLSF